MNPFRKLATLLAKLDGGQPHYWIDDITLLLEIGTIGLIFLLWYHNILPLQ